LLNIKIINSKNIDLCINLLKENKEDLKYFAKIGWSTEEIINQSIKESNHSIGLCAYHKLIGFIIGNMIIADNISEYEIFIVFISNNFRKRGYASYLLNNIIENSHTHMLKRITLEASENNTRAISLYNKNKFNIIGRRKNYYLSNNIREDALIFERILISE
tara:strand:+ start:381 stop:866 length:486 start_codon:yes stop_codon:yes gene_type:complete